VAKAIPEDVRSETIHAIAARLCRKTSLRELRCDQLMAVLDELRKQLRPNAATPKQRDTIMAMARSMGWTMERVAGWCQRQTGKPGIYQLSKTEATKVITGLKILQKAPKNITDEAPR